MFNQTLKKSTEEVFFKHNYTKEIKLDLRKVIFLDNCSTMNIFYNSDLVENITKTGKIMKVQDNGGTLAVTHKATVPGYKQYVWFNKDAITNKISLKNLINKYQVTYDIIDQIFVVHREDQENHTWNSR